MVGCAAVNCSSNSRHGKNKFYKFPTDLERRKRWVINCRRDCWIPNRGNVLCNEHFEASQFEQHRADGRVKLKPNAIPTIFDIPNRPKLLTAPRKSKYKINSNTTLVATVSNSITVQNIEVDNSVAGCPSTCPHEKEVRVLKEDIVNLKRELASVKKEMEELKSGINNMDANFRTFLTEEQINILKCKRDTQKWTDEGILKGFKLRFALGKNGYNYLRSTGFPSPSYSTLNNRVKNFKIEFGVLENVFSLLKSKTAVMNEIEKDCVILIDEMEISGTVNYDKNKQSFVGSITLGNMNKSGNHLLIVLLRGMNSKWKQIVAAHITGPSTSGSLMRNLITEVYTAAATIGLKIRALVSDMGAANKALWSSLGVGVTRSERQIQFSLNDSDESVFVLADVPHLIKNWRSAFINNSEIVLPRELIDQDLLTNVVRGQYVLDLFNVELKSTSGLRLLHHLTASCISPSHFDKMNVGQAARYLSLRTAAALETAVRLRTLPPEALTTAYFIRLLCQWFEILSSRNRMKSITVVNQEQKFKYLLNFVEIIQNTSIGNGWKPLNTGTILSTLSFMEISKLCFVRGYKFILGCRLSQDALENVFSQVRKKTGSTPSAYDVLRAIKLISISQFILKIQDTNYFGDSDKALLEFSNTLSHKNTDFSSFPNPSNDINKEVVFTSLDLNNIYYLSGSCTHEVMKKKLICDNCVSFLNSGGSVLESHAFLTQQSDMGGLNFVSQTVFNMFIFTEHCIQLKKDDLLRQKVSFKYISDSVVHRFDSGFPKCCGLLLGLINHYINIRGYSITNHQICIKKTTN